MARSLDEQPLHLSVAISSYVLALAVFLPAGGWLADRYGTRPIFVSAIILFTTASLACGLATNLGWLVAARVLQGIGGSMMVPVGRLVILRTIPKDQLISAMAKTTIPGLVGPTIGPLLGGFLATYVSWRWIFLINAPVGILGIVLAIKLIPNVIEDAKEGFDFAGFALVAVALTAGIFSLETLGHALLSPAGEATIMGLGCAAGIAYWPHSRHVKRPILDLTLFRLRTFSASTIGGTLYRIGTGSQPFLMPVMLQVGFGLSSFDAGLLTFSSAAGALLIKPLAQPTFAQLGFRNSLTVGALISGLMLMGYIAFRPSTPHWMIAGALLLGGVIRSLQFTGMNAVAYAELPPALTSRANTLASVVQQLAISIGVAVGAAAVKLTQIWGDSIPISLQFVPAFLIVGFMTMASCPIFWRLPAHAGSDISGHGRSRSIR